jgi:L-ascorbate metabolism protein UlaG (beta-lactamase superfamily)
MFLLGRMLAVAGDASRSIFHCTRARRNRPKGGCAVPAADPFRINLVPDSSSRSPNDGVRITFVGHSTVLIELAGVRLLTDPVLRRHVLHIVRQVPAPAPETYADIDAVLLSHLHPDHFDPRSVRRAGSDVAVVAPAGGRATLARRGFKRVTELRAGQTLELGEVKIEAVRAVHDGRRIPLGRAIDAVGYVIEAGGQRVYFAGDTAPFAGIGEIARGLDVAMLPISGWGPRLHAGHHLGPDTAAEAAAALRPRIVVPIHWGTLLRIGLGRRRAELFAGPLDEFAANLARLAPGVELRALAPGESTTLSRAG